MSRILFSKAKDGKGVVATGVEYIAGGTNSTIVVHAKKEVILSAGKAFYVDFPCAMVSFSPSGSLMTPQILELSGA